MGRRSTFTQVLADKICERMIDGESLRSICSDSGMPGRTTVLEWLETNESFRAKYARARESQADYMDDLIIEAAEIANQDNAAAQRVKIDAYKWRASKLKPKVYGDKLDLTSAGERMGFAAELEAARRRAEKGLDE